MKRDVSAYASSGNDESVATSSPTKRPKRQRRRWDFRSMAFFEQRSSSSSSLDSCNDNSKSDHADFTTQLQHYVYPQFGGGGGDGDSEGNPNNADDDHNDDLFEEKQHYVHRLERFALQRHVTEFVLNSDHDRPDEALIHAFERIIKRAIRNAEQPEQQQRHKQSPTQHSGGGVDEGSLLRRVTKIGILLDGKGLSDPIVLPIRPPEQNTAHTLMAELDKLGQSDGDEEVHGGGISKRSLLLSEPIQIVVTCIAPPVGAAPRFHHYQHWAYDQRQLIKIRNFGDNFCLFHALIAARAYSDRELLLKLGEMKKINKNASVCVFTTESAAVARSVMARKDFCTNYEALNRLLSNQSRMSEAARGLMCQAGIDDGHPQAYGIEHIQRVQQHWDLTYPGLYRIVLFADMPEELPRPMWKGPMGRCLVVALFLAEGHFDVIKKIHCFFQLGRKYCIDCECVYTIDAKHTISCKSRCPQCTKVGPQHPCAREPGVSILCPQCHRLFFSRVCFDGHQRGQACSLLKRCTLCNRTFQVDPKRPHKCHTDYCSRCKVYHEKDAGCFIKKIAVPTQNQQYRMICWDTETRLEQTDEGKSQRHKVNHLSACVTCTECCDSETLERHECQICITDEGQMFRTIDWSEASGDEPISAFVEWVLRAWSSKYKTFLWAHNSSRFDGHFILKYLGETSRRPDVVMNGLKLFEFRLQHSRRHSLLVWRDSCLLMPIRLEDLPKTFNLDCADKPFFPYAFNKRGLLCRFDETGKIRKIYKMYEENKSTPFHLPEELKFYCQNDTVILLKAICQFRKILMRDVTRGYDVLPLSCTIASICMNIFRAHFLRDKQLAIVPERGYERNDRASVFAIKYLDWRAKKDGVLIQHAGNGLEKRWKQFKLDGYIAEQNLCIEVLGCYWHGCTRCFDSTDKLVDGKTCSELNEETHVRLLQLREADEKGQLLKVEAIWECEINAQLAANTAMRDFFADLGMERGPIEPRKAYFGGRTGPFKLFSEPKEDEKISVYDIVSLYPWVNYSTEYPVGLPNIIRPSAAEICVNWVRPEDLPYRGLYRVRVLPPRGLRIPVLPVKIDERLLFCCCHHCASKFRKACTRRAYKCTHTDMQRAFTGNYTHLELERALEHGYKVDRFWRAWHYEDWCDQIFKGYVQLLIKLKVEASGFPKGINTIEQKQRYANEYKRIYDVKLEMESIKKNAGLRFIAKLMLNSLWGKFSMRNELGSNKVITRPQEFFSLLFDHKVEISVIVPISERAIRVLFKKKKNFVAEHSSSNIVLSLWTTSRARLKLHDYMMQIEKTEGAKLLYTDTDSVIVLHKRDRVPLQTGEYLGQMSEEYTDYEIQTFVCGGAKQYGFKMKHKMTGETMFIQKIRGITFDVDNSKALKFERFVHKVLNYGNEEEHPTIFSYNKIMPTRDSRVITREQSKKYLPVCQKGFIDEEYEVYPFGYE